MRETIPLSPIPPYKGERYQARIPDTIDLAENCRQAVHNLTSVTDPNLDYDTYFKRGQAAHIFGDICGVKFQEALPLMRIASGSTENMQVDRGLDEIATQIHRHRRALLYQSPLPAR